MKTLRIILSVSLIFLLAACGGQETPDNGSTEPAEAEASAEFVASFESALDHYFSLSEALVAADVENARVHSEAFAAALTEVNASSLSGDAATLWETHKESAIERAQTIVSLQDIEAQRYEFEFLSEAMIESVQELGPLTYTVYQQRCPMVRDGSADWLSKDNAILNPYHGDRMLTCGSVVREI